MTRPAANEFVRVLCAIAIIGLAIVLLEHAASAATVTWDPGLTGSSDGSGTWSTATANWWNGAADAAWSIAGTDTAVFGNGEAGPYTVNASNYVSVGGIAFNVGSSYDISGGTIALGSAAPTITMNATSGTIGSVLTGNTGLTMTGTGMLTLAGTNTYSGPTNVSAGQLSIPANGSINSASAVTVNAGATLAIGQATFSNSLALQGGTLTPALIGGSNAGSGGTITYSGGNVIHTFTSTGSSSLYVPTVIAEASVLVAGGSGGGGENYQNGGGGGGAGGLTYYGLATSGGSSQGAGYPISAGSTVVIVGSGGSAGGTGTNGNGANGGNSVFGSLTAIGGGFGSNGGDDGAAGGSGGGGWAHGGTALQPTSSSGGYGNNGGTGLYVIGGGGGAAHPPSVPPVETA